MTKRLETLIGPFTSLTLELYTRVGAEQHPDRDSAYEDSLVGPIDGMEALLHTINLTKRIPLWRFRGREITGYYTGSTWVTLSRFTVWDFIHRVKAGNTKISMLDKGNGKEDEEA